MNSSTPVLNVEYHQRAMALRYAVAALAFGAANVNAQLTNSDDFYDYGYTSTRVSSSMFWTATVRYMDYISTSVYTYNSGRTSTYTDTYTRTIKPSVTPTATATYTSSYTSSSYDVAIVEMYYANGAVADSDLVSSNDYYAYTTATASTTSTYSSTYYYMPVTMTAPASCPTPFTVATQTSISYIPTVVTDQLKPTSTDAVSTSTYRSYVIEYNTWYLTAGAAPFTSTSDYYYEYYIAECTPPPAQYTSSRGSGSGGSGGSSSGSSGTNGNDESWMDYRTCYFGGCTSVKTWIIVIATVLPGIFLLGFLESWLWYTRLMKGKSALRCGTVCWVILSLWVLCFTRMQDARSKEDQKLLQQKWKEMPAGQKFKNWSWGFRRRYPVPLLGQFSMQTVGIVPEGQPLHPAMAQAPAGQVFYYGPPPPGAPGWHQPPNGGTPVYAVPQPGNGQHDGYYATNMPKDGVVVGSAPVMQQQQRGAAATPAPPQAPQPTYHPPTSPPPNTQLPVQPQPASTTAANVSEAPASQPSQPAVQPQPTNPAPATPANVSEPPASQAPEPATQSHSAPPPPAKNDPNDRSLYE
ncbi:hypothetical protein N0V94_000202 [Neodidymelliopsis sp. IMI 364377]|nr:hypothetical protein N0V94_000202 [Neodidymelliopsis sp. IMI 364377]